MCLNAIRRKRLEWNYTEVLVKEHHSDLSSPVEYALSRKELNSILYGEAEILPDLLREVFILRGFREMDFASVAEALGITVAKAKKFMVKAVRIVMTRLKMKKIGKGMFDL